MRKSKKENELQSVDSYFDTVEAGERRTLSDEKTKLFLRAKQAMQIVKVDQGIVKDAGISGENQIRKCDYLCKNDAHKQVHLIELKGEVIKDAFCSWRIRRMQSKKNRLMALCWMDFPEWMPTSSVRRNKESPQILTKQNGDCAERWLPTLRKDWKTFSSC